jgi:hypothetical protein
VVVAISVMLGACYAHHDPNAVEVSQLQCVLCHKPQYDATGTAQYPNSPAHAPSGCSTDCALCHIAPTAAKPWDGWTNNIGGCNHPEATFPITTGPHVRPNVTCMSCHALPDTPVGGANTVCATCHPSTEPFTGGGTMASGHLDITTFDGYTTAPSGFTTQNFCLSCHANGLEIPHPDAIWPQTHNAHTCSDCHDRSIGSDQMGENASCLRCHRNAHNQAMGSPLGCLQMGCHYRGGRALAM